LDISTSQSKIKDLKVNGGRGGGGGGFFLGSRNGGGGPSIYTAINKPSQKRILKMDLLGPKIRRNGLKKEAKIRKKKNRKEEFYYGKN